MSCKQKTGRWYALQTCPCRPKAADLSEQVSAPKGVLACAEERNRKRAAERDQEAQRPTHRKKDEEEYKPIQEQEENKEPRVCSWRCNSCKQDKEKGSCSQKQQNLGTQ